MSFRASIITAGLLTGLGAFAPQAVAGNVTAFSGAVLGEVHSAGGVAQMGASVSLFNRFDQLVRQVLTDQAGKFAFDGIPPEVYSVRVNLASFFPAVRPNIMVAPGSENLLHVNLGTLFSGIDLAPPSSIPGALMSDEWKWVLRTSAATRPVLRLTQTGTSSSNGGRRHPMATFTETTGVVKLSAGDSGAVAGIAAQDLGTAFAVATRMNGASSVRLSGNFSYLANSGLPMAAFRTTYSKDEDGQAGPQFSLTLHQIYFPGLGPSGNLSGYTTAGGESGPALRTVSMGSIDKLQVSDEVLLEYGGHVDTVSFINSTARMTPFARLTYTVSGEGAFRVAYSSGTTPTELLNRDAALRNSETGDSGLNQDLAALAMLPAITRDNNQIHMERTRNLEVGYQAEHGSRKYYLSAFSQAVSDAAFNMSAPPVFQTRADLLPALDGNYYVFDIGSYQRNGYSLAMTQAAGDHAEFTIAAGSTGDLASNPLKATGSTAADVRGEVRAVQGVFLTARASAVIPGIGMRVATSYGWAPAGVMMPARYSLTSPVDQHQGLNIVVHQPLPHLIGFKGRVEATGELRNALAEGYLPVTAAGHCSVLTDSPRTLRGGLSFLF